MTAGVFLGENEELNKSVLEEFTKLFNFNGMEFDDALRFRHDRDESCCSNRLEPI